MKSPEEFDNYYKSTLVPVLESLEPQRKKVVSTFWSAMLSLLLFVPVVLLFLAVENPWILLLLALPVFLAVKKFSEYSKAKSAYVIHFKQTVIGGMVKAIGDQLNYSPLSFITVNEYHEGDLFRQRIDSYAGGDLIDGKFGATTIKFSELHHQERRETTDSKGNRRTYWVTIFKGIFFIADFNKNFDGATYVLPDSGFDFLGIGKMLEKWFEGRGDPILLENPMFEKYFKVFGTDQVEARYILSPSLMERLVEFREKVRERIFISFIHSKVFVAVPVNQNLFEPNEFSSGVNEDYLKKYFYFLTLLTGIVDDLNLNTRIWTKK